MRRQAYVGGAWTAQHFQDLRSLLSAAALLREDNPNLRLVVTVPTEASAKDRALIDGAGIQSVGLVIVSDRMNLTHLWRDLE